jgi:lipoate-protein ligase A
MNMPTYHDSPLPFEKSTWRLVTTPPDTGPWNMAVDEAILESVGLGNQPSTLRLYSWEPPCLSLGYAQPSADVDFSALQTLGWDLVRRPTGGRAILHTDELTYSVTASHAEPRMSGSVLESYRRIAAALLAALHNLEIPAQSSALAQPASGSDAKGAVCFETPSNYEITINGKKLVGSAQARRKEGILQHGSFPLIGDLRRITQVLAFPDQAARLAAAQRLLDRATTAEQILGYPLDWKNAAQAFTQAFETMLNLELIHEDLSESEHRRAVELVSDKYSHPSWNLRI